MDDPNPNVFNRFEVISVKRFQSPSIRKLMIEMKHLSSNKIFGCHLFGSWYWSKVFRGNIMNVRSNDFDGQIYYINDNHGSVIINPDILIPVTSVSRSKGCMRREWLGRLFNGGLGKHDLYSAIGLVVRDIFQAACKARASSLSQLKEIKEQCFERRDIISLISSSGLDKEMLIKEVDESLESILSWLEKYLLQSGQLDDGTSIQVDEVRDIEESVWCPSLGLSGRVNINCEVKIHDQKDRVKLVPLTMNIGRSSNSRSGHQARSKLYSMMMRERNSLGCDEGLLLSLRNDDGEPKPVMDLIKVDHDAEKNLLQIRNSLAHYLSPDKEDFSGPNFRRLSYGDSYCKGCRQLFNCSLMAKSFEQDKIQEPGRQELINETLSHLGPEGIEFFTKWMRLIKRTMKANDYPFWWEDSSLREKKNLGLGNLVIDVHEKSDGDTILRRAGNIEKKFTNQPGLLNRRVALSKDEPCSEVQAKSALFFSYVTKVEENTIEVNLDQNVKNFEESTKYRLDIVDYKDLPFFYNYHLSKLMSKTCSKDLKHLGNGTENISVKNLGDQLSLELSERCDLEKNKESEFCSFENSLDKRNTYRLAHGMSDKIIDSMGRFISKTEKYFLIVTHGPPILNRVIFTLKEYRVDFICFGMHSNCDPNTIDYTIEKKIEKERRNNPKVKLEGIYRNIRVAIAACSALSDYPRLLWKDFDLSIIFEANKIPLPDILSPLFISNRFVLIDDESHKPSADVSNENVLLEKLVKLLWLKRGEHLESQSSSSTLDRIL